MDWQQFVSLLIVAITALLLGHHEWRRRQRMKFRACGNDCGCSSRVLERIKAEARTEVH